MKGALPSNLFTVNPPGLIKNQQARKMGGVCLLPPSRDENPMKREISAYEQDFIPQAEVDEGEKVTETSIPLAGCKRKASDVDRCNVATEETWGSDIDRKTDSALLEKWRHQVDNAGEEEKDCKPMVYIPPKLRKIKKLKKRERIMQQKPPTKSKFSFQPPNGLTLKLKQEAELANKRRKIMEISDDENPFLNRRIYFTPYTKHRNLFHQRDKFFKVFSYNILSDQLVENGLFHRGFTFLNLVCCFLIDRKIVAYN